MSLFRVTALLLLVVTPALAQEALPAPLTRDASIARAMERFRQMDANGDAVVTRAEFEGWTALRRGRQMAPVEGDTPPSVAKRDRIGHGADGFGARMFGFIDTDGDGKVTQAEAQAAAAAQFDRRDLDHDGVLSPDEQRAGRASGGPPR